jgi:hypothetical protein
MKKFSLSIHAVAPNVVWGMSSCLARKTQKSWKYKSRLIAVRFVANACVPTASARHCLGLWQPRYQRS